MIQLKQASVILCLVLISAAISCGEEFYDVPVLIQRLPYSSETRQFLAKQWKGLDPDGKAYFASEIRKIDQRGRAEKKQSELGRKGSAHLASGHYFAAFAILDLASELDPEDHQTMADFASANTKLGFFQPANLWYAKAISVDPTNAGHLNDYAWMLATCPEKNIRNGKKSLRYSRLAVELSNRKNLSYLDTLAASYAEVNDFRMAKKIQTIVVDLVDNDKSEIKLKPIYLRNLELFKNGQPVRETPWVDQLR